MSTYRPGFTVPIIARKNDVPGDKIFLMLDETKRYLN